VGGYPSRQGKCAYSHFGLLFRLQTPRKKNSAEIQTDSRTVEHERRVSNMLQLFHFLLVNPVTVDAMSLPVLVYSGAQKTPTTRGMDDDAELKKASPFSIRRCSGFVAP